MDQEEEQNGISHVVKKFKNHFPSHDPLLFKVVECLKSISLTISINFIFQGFGKKITLIVF